MKILHVLQNYHPSIGGTQWLFQNISERLVSDYGDEVTVFTTNSYYGPQRKQFKLIEERESMVNGVRVIRFPYIRRHYVFFSILYKILKKCSIKMPEVLLQKWYGPTSASLTKALIDGNYDVVCASSYFYSFMHYPLFRHKGEYPKPFVFMGAMHLSENKKMDNIMVQTINAIKASEYYIANTTFEKGRLVEFGIQPSSIDVIGCGVDPLLFQYATGSGIRQELGIKGKTVIGYFGRHDKIKGIDIVLKAFERVAKNNEDIVLIIAGSRSAYTQEIETTISSFAKNVQSRCHIVSDINEQLKADVYNSFDIFVSPSTHESFGIVFLEAWACKKPVIGANIGAVRSVISQNIDGLLVEPGNIEQLEAHLQLLVNDSQLRAYMGQNGYNKVMERYTWSAIVSKYRQTYAKAMATYKEKVELAK